MDKSLTIGVFFGSRSPEHDISIITGQLIISGLLGMGLRVLPVYIGKNGEWMIGESLGTLRAFTQEKRILDRHLQRYALDLQASRGRLVFHPHHFLRKHKIIDIAFPAFHGSYGEDGTIQGLFEIFDVPYVGCDVVSSAVTMDKIWTKQHFTALGIPTTDFLFYENSDWQGDRKKVLAEIESRFHFPIFIKPARLGSSIAITKVKDSRELEEAVDLALHYDERFLAEEAVPDLMDVTCAVLGGSQPRSSLLQESVFGQDMLSYEDKYRHEGGTQLGKGAAVVIPARLSAETTEELRSAAVKIFKAFGCYGTARVDFLYNKQSKKYYANEINTLPGTLYHHLWKKSGIEFPVLLNTLLDLALERAKSRGRAARVFSSDLLKFAGSQKLRYKGGENEGL